MQLQPVHTHVGGVLCAAYKVGLDLRHVFECHGFGRLAHTRQVLLLGRGDDGPVGIDQRLVNTFPGEAGRSLGTGMADLHRELGVGVGVDPVGDTFPGPFVFRRVHAGATGCDASLGADTGHLGKHHGRATHGACAQVHEVVVTGHAVHSRILRHGRHHHTVLQREAAHGVGREHGWRRRFVGRHRDTGLLGKPALVTTKPLRVAKAQVLV